MDWVGPISTGFSFLFLVALSTLVNRAEARDIKGWNETDPAEDDERDIVFTAGKEVYFVRAILGAMSPVFFAVLYFLFFGSEAKVAMARTAGRHATDGIVLYAICTLFAALSFPHFLRLIRFLVHRPRVFVNPMGLALELGGKLKSKIGWDEIREARVLPGIGDIVLCLEDGSRFEIPRLQRPGEMLTPILRRMRVVNNLEVPKSNSLPLEIRWILVSLGPTAVCVWWLLWLHSLAVTPYGVRSWNSNKVNAVLAVLMMGGLTILLSGAYLKNRKKSFRMDDSGIYLRNGRYIRLEEMKYVTLGMNAQSVVLKLKSGDLVEIVEPQISVIFRSIHSRIQGGKA
jgi:hypothetical protein